MGVTSDLRSSSSSQGIAQARLALLLLRSSVLIEFSLREALEEIASWVFEYARLNDEYARDICLYYFHNIMSYLYIVCPQADFWGERELSRIIRELKEMGPQADFGVNSNYHEFISNYQK